MTVLHYLGVWIYIGEPAPDDKSFHLTSDEWREIKELDATSAKFTLHVKKIIEKENNRNDKSN